MTNKELERYFHDIVVWWTATHPYSRYFDGQDEYVWLERMGLIETSYIISCR